MQIIAQRQQSGLTVKEFCAQQDIPIKQYYYYTFLKSCRIQQTSKMPKPWINTCLGQQSPRKNAKHK